MKQHAKLVFVAAGLLGVPAFAGCGGSSGSSSALPVTPQPRSASAITVNGLIATLREDADSVSAGGSLTYTVALTNPTSQPITMQLTGCTGPVNTSLPEDVVTFINAAGVQVYPVVSDGLNPCAAAPPVAQTLAPGQTLTDAEKLYAASAPQLFSAKGIYTVKAQITTSAYGADQTTVGPLTLTVQ